MNIVLSHYMASVTPVYLIKVKK